MLRGTPLRVVIEQPRRDRRPRCRSSTVLFFPLNLCLMFPETLAGTIFAGNVLSAAAEVRYGRDVRGSFDSPEDPLNE